MYKTELLWRQVNIIFNDGIVIDKRIKLEIVNKMLKWCMSWFIHRGQKVMAEWETKYLIN